MAEGTHFLAGTDMADVAWKLVAVNLSDLAAKGAEPVGVLLGYSLGQDDERFVDGLRDVLARYDVPLLGGDTIRSPGPRTFGLTAIGRACHAPVPSRSGARPGDEVWVCGTIGDASQGFLELTRQDAGDESGSPRKPDPYFTEKLLRPQPLLDEGKALAPCVTAMMDVSDGLLLDAERMARASGVTIDISSGQIPFSAPFMAAIGNDSTFAARRHAASWGDDYALLFTMPAGTRPPAASCKVGVVLPRSGAPLLLDGSEPSPDAPLGYTH